MEKQGYEVIEIRYGDQMPDEYGEGWDGEEHDDNYPSWTPVSKFPSRGDGQYRRRVNFGRNESRL
jgi:hypothetical protein